MKLLHTSDLHLGIRLGEYSLIEDQEYILNSIVRLAEAEAVDGVIIAGDIYDRSVPSAEAVALFDDFITKINGLGIRAFIISGNHDSSERVACGASLMAKSGVHISPVFGGVAECVSLQDEYGEVRIHLLPFIKPAYVRRFFECPDELSYTDALRQVISGMNIDKGVRNVILTHQFVTGASRSESEDISVGGCDNVDVSVYANFDYVAMGHIHSPQCCGDEHINYSGTPLKYSFSEVNDIKSVTVVELLEKGSLTVRRIPLAPRRDLKLIKGSYAELTSRSYYEGTGLTDDYIGVCLTDEEDVVDAISKLRIIYKNIVKLWYSNSKTDIIGFVDMPEDALSKSPYDMFEEFYRARNGADMSRSQAEYIRRAIEKVWEGNDETD